MSRRCQEGPAAAGWGGGREDWGRACWAGPGVLSLLRLGPSSPVELAPTGRQAKGSSGPAGGGFRPPGGLLSPARTSRASRKPHPTP